MMDTTGWSYDDPNNTSAPSWMGSGSYAKWTQGDPGYDPNDPAVKQNWWRGPSVAGGLVWHPYWGWQDRSAVKNLYKSDANNDVTWDEFTNWGLTKQLGEDWRQYYPTYQTDAELGANGGDANAWSGTLSLGNGTGGTYGGNYTYPTGGTTMDTSNLGAFQNYPSQWGQSQEILNYLGSNTPWQTDQASQTASQMAQTGMATSADPWYRAAQAKGWYDTQDAINNAAERAGLGGTRWSSTLGRAAQDIAGRQAASLASDYAQQTMSAQEAARARQLQAASQLQGLGTDVNNQLFGVSDRLGTLGQQMFSAPQQLAQTAYTMGQGNQQTEQNAIDKYFSEFLRTADENNPYLGMIYQMATGQGIPQQYAAGGGSQLLSALGSIGSLFSGK